MKLKYKIFRVCAFLAGVGILSGLVAVYSILASWLITAAANNDPMTVWHVTGLVLGLLGLYPAFGLFIIGGICLIAAFSEFGPNEE